MANRRPLVLVDGLVSEMPSGDMLPSAVVPSGGGGGGGGGGSDIQYDNLNIGGNTASGTSFATKGTMFIALAGFTISGLVARCTMVAGAIYRARVYELSGTTATSTIMAILDAGIDITPAIAETLPTFLAPLSGDVAFEKGKVYAICLSRTDGTGTYVLPIGSNGGANIFSRCFPIASIGRLQIASASPTVGTANAGYAAGGGVEIGIIGNAASIT